jgi:hypothetical protein
MLTTPLAGRSGADVARGSRHHGCDNYGIDGKCRGHPYKPQPALAKADKKKQPAKGWRAVRMVEQPGVVHISHPHGNSGFHTLCSWVDAFTAPSFPDDVPNCASCLEIVAYCRNIKL